MSRNEDIRLIARCLLTDDRRAYTRLVDKYHPPVVRFFLNQTLGDAMLSDDLAQETFVRAYTHLRSFKGLSSFSTWIFRIAYRVFYDEMRARRSRAEQLAGWECAESEPPGDRAVERKIDIYRAMQLLSPDERAVVQLYYMEDMAVNRVADVLEMPSGTVKSHLMRARQKLEVYLEKEDYRYEE
ncbi:MAG: sigma-70 family RNA polymerase sigma factor [Coprobacter sp.]|nr:sigma-70 family RNA polymerase sigma factor [Coprobacter sp.]